MSVRVGEHADDRCSGHSLGQVTRSRSGFVDVIRISARHEQELDCRDLTARVEHREVQGREALPVSQTHIVARREAVSYA